MAKASEKPAKKEKKPKVEIDRSKLYAVKEACELCKKAAVAGFDETIEMHFKLGIDPKQSEQNVRGIVVLPHGSGKTRRVVVLAKGEKMKEAEANGADAFGSDEIIEKISKGWLDFDVLVATPDVMKDLTKLAKVLGPKGLMPNPKAGTVTFDIAKTVKELKAGRIEYKADPTGIVHAPIGKASFPADKISENAKTLLEAITAAKPATSKGVYLQSVTLSSTMGPGIRVNPELKAA